MPENKEKDNLDELLDQLKNDTTLTQPATSEKTELNLTDENVNDYILKKVGRLIEGGVDTIEALRESVLASCEPSELEAYSELFRAVTTAADTLNRINVQNKKDKTAKELKQMDIKARIELPENKKGDTNILIAPREEIFKKFLDKNKDIIDIEIEEDLNDEE